MPNFILSDRKLNYVHADLIRHLIYFNEKGHIFNFKYLIEPIVQKQSQINTVLL
jgi:hypothetical protein